VSILDELGLDPDNVRWEDLASCKNLPDVMINLFFDDYEEDEVFAREADQICLACPVIKQCLEDGMSNQQWGCWGGVYLTDGEIDAKLNKHKNEEDWDAWRFAHRDSEE
jgi:Transcription factor WhiB